MNCTDQDPLTWAFLIIGAISGFVICGILVSILGVDEKRKHDEPGL
jgi:hypothetical protein